MFEFINKLERNKFLVSKNTDKIIKIELLNKYFG